MGQETKTATEVAAELEKKLEAAENEAKSAKEAVEELKRTSATAEELKKATDDLTKTMGIVEALNGKLQILSAGTNTDERASDFKTALEQAFSSEQFKKGAREALERKNGSFSMDVEVKFSTSDVTNPISTTQMFPGVYADPDAANAFLELFSANTIPTGKNKVAYIDAAFTDNTGYAEEMVELTSANTAVGEEKSRELAKIGSFMPFSAEMIEDNAPLLAWAQQQCMRAIRAKADTELWSGAGADTPGNKKKIYGLKTQGSTPFNAVTAGLAAKFEKANLADLVAACITQIEVQGKGVYTPTTVMLHPSDYAELAGQKNTLGNYLNILPGGTSMVLHGLDVRKSVKVAPCEMAVLSRQTLMLGDKRTFTIEIERKPNTDSYILWIYWRGQGVVTEPNKLANIYVANITTAIAAISKTNA